MVSKLEALGDIARRLSIREWRSIPHVRSCANALPIGNRAVGRAVGNVVIKTTCRSSLIMVVSRHHDRCLESTWQVPESGQRASNRGHLLNHVHEQALLLVRDRYLDF